MKKRIIIGVLVCLFLLTGCGHKELEGYWCNYKETSTIVVLLNDDNTESDRNAIIQKARTFENLSSDPRLITKQEYATELGGSIENLDIYDTFIISFSSMDHIGTYIEEIQGMSGVKSATQSYAKTNLSLYYLGDKNQYSFTDSDEASDEDLIKGKYKIKNGVITFTPNDKDAVTNMLYIKDDILCGDANCNTIYARSNGTCGTDE